MGLSRDVMSVMGNELNHKYANIRKASGMDGDNQFTPEGT